MKNLFLWILVYTSVLALSQIMLKIGLNQVGSFGAKGIRELFALVTLVFTNFYVLSGTLLMAGSYFLWLAILSWFKLSLAFPLTAIGFVLVAVFSYFMLGEKLLPHNYLGILLIAFGIWLLLFKQV